MFPVRQLTKPRWSIAILLLKKDHAARDIPVALESNFVPPILVQGGSNKNVADSATHCLEETRDAPPMLLFSGVLIYSWGDLNEKENQPFLIISMHICKSTSSGINSWVPHTEVELLLIDSCSSPYLVFLCHWTISALIKIWNITPCIFGMRLVNDWDKRIKSPNHVDPYV